MSTKDLKLFDLLDGLEMTKSQYEWLARRFENMTAKEALLFRGAMQIEQPQATCDVMQIANQLEHYELLYGAGNDFALGNFVMEHIFYPSSQTREFLDPAKVGAAYRQKDGNTFCDGNFIRLSSPLDLFQNSDPATLPDRGDYGIRVKLASRNNMEGIWVGFPDTSEYMDSSHPDELLLALDALEAETLTECIAVDVDCCLPQLGDILSQYDSAAELIRHAIDFGYVWAEQGQGEPRWLDKWQAVMELEDCHQLDYALDLAQNLHCYNFMPRDMEVAEYGRLLAKQDGVYPNDALLAESQVITLIAVSAVMFLVIGGLAFISHYYTLDGMPKGSFIVAKTGVHPMKVKLRLFLDWGIRFGEPYEVPEKAQRAVAYADKQELEESIIRRHYGTVAEEEPPQDVPAVVGGMNHGMQAEKNSRKTILRP